VHNISREQLMSLYSNAAGLFNVCGVTQLREEHLKCPVRVYIDTDPGFEQAKLAAHDPKYIENIGAHTHHFTYGQNIGNADCKIPLSNINWYPTWPPVLIDLWATDGAAAEPFFSSIATWENQGKDIEIAGETYRWSKQSNFMKFLDLPRHAPQRFRLALRAPDANVEASLRKCGWELVDPGPLSSDIAPYRDFIVRSRAEFTVAKDIYVRPKTGWFSDRSVCYLAAGRPVIAQETGYSKFIKTGKGLFPFSTMAEIVDACARVNADYAMQAVAARETASAFFRAEAILAQMLETCSL
jgi:hypothetical protein